MKQLYNHIVLEVPKEAKNFTIINSHSYFKSPRVEHSIGGVDLPYKVKTITDWEIVGTLSEIILDEEICKGIVNPALTNHGYEFYDFSINEYRTDMSASESLKSFIQMYFKNNDKEYLIIKQK